MRYGPTIVGDLASKTIVSGATGKQHTLFVTADGDLFACGSSKQGCVGPAASKKGTYEAKPIAIKGVENVSTVTCGSNFNLVVDGDGGCWAFGWSEFGVLGNGDDGEHNTKDSSVKLSYVGQTAPSKIQKLSDYKIIDVACGQSHCAAVASDGTVFTWGNGNYGKLGHRDQNDKWLPTELKEIRAKTVTCGHSFTAVLGWPVLRNGVVASSGKASLYMWGKVKAANQNAWMYPQTEDDLRGWQIHQLSSGFVHNVVHADESVISWGSPCGSGELGYGAKGPKSSARPKKIDSLEGLKVSQVSCGMAHTLILAERDDSITASLPEWKPKQGAAPVGKRAAEASASSKGKKGKR